VTRCINEGKILLGGATKNIEFESTVKFWGFSPLFGYTMAIEA